MYARKWRQDWNHLIQAYFSIIVLMAGSSFAKTARRKAILQKIFIGTRVEFVSARLDICTLLRHRLKRSKRGDKHSQYARLVGRKVIKCCDSCVVEMLGNASAGYLQRSHDQEILVLIRNRDALCILACGSKRNA